MNTQNTLKIYEKKNGYQFFFIRKELHSMFDGLRTFSLVCSDGKHYEDLEISKSGTILRYFIFANDFFKEHPLLKKHAEIPFSVDKAKGIVKIMLS